MCRTGAGGSGEPPRWSRAGAAPWPPAPRQIPSPGKQRCRAAAALAPGPVSPPSQGHRPHLPPTITAQIPPQSHATNRTAPSPRRSPGRGQVWEHIQHSPPLGCTQGCTGTCTVMARLRASARMQTSTATARLRVSMGCTAGFTPRFKLRSTSGMHTGMHSRIHTGDAHGDEHQDSQQDSHPHPTVKPHTGTAALLLAEGSAMVTRSGALTTLH